MSGAPCRAGVLAVVVDGHEVSGGDGSPGDERGRHRDGQGRQPVPHRDVGEADRTHAGARRRIELQDAERLASDHFAGRHGVGGDPRDEPAPPHPRPLLLGDRLEDGLGRHDLAEVQVTQDLELRVGGQRRRCSRPGRAPTAPCPPRSPRAIRRVRRCRPGSAWAWSTSGASAAGPRSGRTGTGPRPSGST